MYQNMRRSACTREESVEGAKRTDDDDDPALPPFALPRVPAPAEPDPKPEYTDSGDDGDSGS